MSDASFTVHSPGGPLKILDTVHDAVDEAGKHPIAVVREYRGKPHKRLSSVTVYPIDRKLSEQATMAAAQCRFAQLFAPKFSDRAGPWGTVCQFIDNRLVPNEHFVRRATQVVDPDEATVAWFKWAYRWASAFSADPMCQLRSILSMVLYCTGLYEVDNVHGWNDQWTHPFEFPCDAPVFDCEDTTAAAISILFTLRKLSHTGVKGLDDLVALVQPGHYTPLFTVCSLPADVGVKHHAILLLVKTQTYQKSFSQEVEFTGTLRFDGVVLVEPQHDETARPRRTKTLPNSAVFYSDHQARGANQYLAVCSVISCDKPDAGQCIPHYGGSNGVLGVDFESLMSGGRPVTFMKTLEGGVPLERSTENLWPAPIRIPYQPPTEPSKMEANEAVFTAVSAAAAGATDPESFLEFFREPRGASTLPFWFTDTLCTWVAISPSAVVATSGDVELEDHASDVAVHLDTVRARDAIVASPDSHNPRMTLTKWKELGCPVPKGALATLEASMDRARVAHVFNDCAARDDRILVETDLSGANVAQCRVRGVSSVFVLPERAKK